MEKDIVGFSITTELLLEEDILKREDLGKLLINMENEIASLIESKFRAKVIGGKGKHIKTGKDNILIK